MWQELSRILAMLADQYRKLKELSKEKHNALVLMKMQELEQILTREEAIIKNINQAEKQRQEVLAKLAATEIKLDHDIHKQDVWGHCPDAVTRQLLFRLHKTLSREVKEAQEAAANNEILIHGALDAINFRLNQLGGSRVEPAYGSGGQEQVSHRKNFDLEV